ncbi:MAG: methionine synthase [Phycisphaerales bacterium]
MNSRFASESAKRVLVFDGAMGTSIHNCNCDLHKDYLGKENCTEVLVLTRPDVIQSIHESFLEVGADVVETDTFGANKLVFAEFDLVDKTYEINKRAAEIARAACDKHSSPSNPKFVAGSMGPGTRLLTLGHTTWDDMLDSYLEQARGLIAGGADCLVVETAQDILQVKCAINACLKALHQAGKTTNDIPILASVTIETTGTMLLGTEIAAAAEALRPFPIFSLGLNCATGPTEMAEHVRWLARHWDRPISVMPNAGLPVLVDGKTDYPLKPKPFAEALLRYVNNDGVRIVGGCCGTTPEHIRLLARSVQSAAPTPPPKEHPGPGCSSLYSPVPFKQDSSFLIVGERTNTNGSKKFRDLLNDEDFEGLVSMARDVVRDGSHCIDVCVDYVGRDGVRDMREVVQRFARQVAVPLMLDSTQTDVLEEGLKHAPGRCIVNSMNLEDGEEKLAHICRLAATYGAAVVAGTIDEDPVEAMAKTADRKIAIAKRIRDLAVKHGLRASDILFDPLVLPITTGVEADRRLALETIEGIRRISTELPECHTVIGLSNVSFGLKPHARTVLNSVFLHECLEAGLTGAIAHYSKILPRTRIPDDQWNAALDLIYDRRTADKDPLLTFIALFPDDAAGATEKKKTLADLPLEERLQRHIIDGELRGLPDTIDAALKLYPPLDIINNHLLAGMKVVGDLFATGEMQLPFVLQSAEVMKAAVKRLEPHMEKTEGQTRGSIVLATVQGDVHDIGKNLVDIILTNNGYTVHNLGIKQPLQNILNSLKETNAQAVGMSGLLVKSVAVMRDNLEQMASQGLNVPVVLGGAALTRHYCETDLRSTYSSGHVYFGKDAFEGLRVMDHIVTGRTHTLDEEIRARLDKRAAAEETISRSRARREDELEEARKSAPAATALQTAPRSVSPATSIPTAPFWGSRLVDNISLDLVYPFINTVALFRGQWQFKKGAMNEADYQRQIDEQVTPLFERLKKSCRDESVLKPAVVYGYFPCNSDGDDLVVFDPHDHDREVERFSFPRQDGRKRLCISDFFLPRSSGKRDVLAMHCVTVGDEASRRAKLLFESNQYAEYLYLHGLGVETAEALAELWHKRIRQELDIANEDSPNVRELFTQHYQGSRYSFGYPACPDMADQEKLFRLLQPERIGCRLTENFQIDPEQSTSAIIVHHPEAKYFAV